VDVIDVTNGNVACSPIPSYPVEAEHMVSTYLDGKVYSCGGGFGDDTITECFLLDETLVWTPIGNADRRENAASSLIDDVWWITGGYYRECTVLTPPEQVLTIIDRSDSLIFDGKQFSPGPSLPTNMDSHCQVTMNDTHVFFAGFFNRYYATVMNWETKEWTELANIPNELPRGACGLLHSPDLGPEILLADGQLAFFFSLTSGTWREGQIIPEAIKYQSYQQLDDGFLSIGGTTIDGGEPVDSVYKFVEETYEWELMSDRLSQPDSNLATVAVPGEFLNCQ